METHKKFKIEQNALRIFVFVTGIGMTVYCALLCFGVRHFVAELICVTFGYALLAGGAWIFKLCPLSWAFIIYTYVIRVCIILYPEKAFEGTWNGCYILDIAHQIALTAGVLLVSFFLLNIRKYYRIICGTKYNDNEADSSKDGSKVTAPDSRKD